MAKKVKKQVRKNKSNPGKKRVYSKANRAAVKKLWGKQWVRDNFRDMFNNVAALRKKAFFCLADDDGLSTIMENMKKRKMNKHLRKGAAEGTEYEDWGVW